MIPEIVLKKNRDEALRRFHPWVFSGAVYNSNPSLKNGDDVYVNAADGSFLAYGHFYHNSIAVKIYSFQKVNPDYNFWKDKIENAIQTRRLLGFFDNPNTNAFRLINGEGDFMPGLIVDKYADTLVIQCHTEGMYRLINTFAEIFTELLPNLKSIYNKSASALKNTDLKTEDGFLMGSETDNVIIENGMLFSVDIVGGQKTGFFLDQRDNRFLLGQYAKDKTVLNAYCYSGGFSVSALRSNAKKVDSVDVSAKAIDLTNDNVLLNKLTEIPNQSFVEDVHAFLKSCDFYDLIILDPPAFAKHHSQKMQAVKGYRNINRYAIRKLRRGGVLFTFSCSQAMDVDLFLSTVVSAAIEEGRQCRVVERLSQPADHPLNAFQQEGVYLKGLVLIFD